MDAWKPALLIVVAAAAFVTFLVAWVLSDERGGPFAAFLRRHSLAFLRSIALLWVGFALLSASYGDQLGTATDLLLAFHFAFVVPRLTLHRG